MLAFLAKSIRRAGGPGFIAFVTFLCVSVAFLWVLSFDARQQLTELATAPGDNLQWTLSQLEVEYRALENATLDASEDDPDSLAELRRRFDIVYSRFATIRSANSFAPVREDPGMDEAIARVADFLEGEIPLIDGSDQALVADLDGLLERANAIFPDVRTITLVGVKVYSQINADKRERAADALFDLAMLILFLVLLLLGLVTLLARVLATTRRQYVEIEQTRSRLGSIVGTSLDAIIAIDREGIVIEYNPAAERVFGFLREEALGQNMVDMIVPEALRAQHVDGMRRHQLSGKKRIIDSGLVQLEARRKDGTIFPVELSVSTAQSAEGLIYIAFVRDISKRVAAEQELVEARDQALQGERAKADMLAIMSHEMRTPLNGILGTLDLLDSTDLNPRQQRFVDVMATSGRLLLRHVNDVLNLSRMDMDSVEPDVAPFQLQELTESVVTSMRGQAEARGNTLSAHLLGALPQAVMGDRDRLEQVLINLVGNAVKFTQDGEITVEIEADPGTDDVELRVIDTGIGIAQADQDRVFGDFVTVDASYGRRNEGTGLGLGITRRLAHVMGGEVGVESELGQGSVFWVRVPLPSAEADIRQRKERALVPDQNTQGRKVLLVEDNEINRLVCREMLVQMGCSVDEAVDGAEGIRCADAKPYDLILMDIGMPVLDGKEAAQRILQGDGPNVATPLIALTAHAMPDDIQKFKKTGFRDVLIKPLSRSKMRDALADNLAERPLNSVCYEADDLEEILGGEAAKEVRTKAVLEIREALDGIEATLGHGFDRDAAGAMVHRVLGLAALVGLCDAHEQLLAFEIALGGEGEPDVPGRLADVRATLPDVRDAA